jgi:hypothetical protein
VSIIANYCGSLTILGSWVDARSVVPPYNAGSGTRDL